MTRYPVHSTDLYAAALILLAAAAANDAAAGPLKLHTRQRVETPKGSNLWEIVQREVEWEANKTAIVICDMWDRHWCQGATRRVAEMAPRMNEVVKAARSRGALVIHCPSDTLKFYDGTPQRKLAQSAPPATAKVPLQRWCGLDPRHEAALPIDDSDGGCDDTPPCRHPPYPWTRQIATLEIEASDAITDSAEAYHLLQQRGIENVIVMGVHLNMCVLGRPFGIRQLVAQGKNVMLTRDLTDTMYNSRRRPWVPHCAGTDLMIEHVERYWCPTITSVDLLGGEPFRFREDVRPLVVFMIGEEEYKTAETLPAFARQELEWRGIRSAFALENPTDKNDFPGLEALREANLLVLSVRRRTPSKNQMALIRQHLAAGKPVLGIRTASHAFGATPKDSLHEGWETLDVDLLGTRYEGHYGKGPITRITTVSPASPHPILTGVPANGLTSPATLYRGRNLSPTVVALLEGTRNGEPGTEPVAWVNTNQNRRVFYTSLGIPDDFKQPGFRRLLLNGLLWCLDRPIPPAGKEAASTR